MGACTRRSCCSTGSIRSTSSHRFEVLAAGSEEVGGELEVELVSAEGPRPVVSGTCGTGVARDRSTRSGKPGVVDRAQRRRPIDGDPDEVDTDPCPARPVRRDARRCPADCARRRAQSRRHRRDGCGGSLALAMAGLPRAETPSATTSALDVRDATGVDAVNARVVDDGDLVSGGWGDLRLDLALAPPAAATARGSRWPSSRTVRLRAQRGRYGPDWRLGRDDQDADRIAGRRLVRSPTTAAPRGTATGKGETVPLQDIVVGGTTGYLAPVGDQADAAEPRVRRRRSTATGCSGHPRPGACRARR